MGVGRGRRATPQAKEYWDKMSAKLEQMDAEIEERKQAVREYARKYEEGQRQRMEQRKAEAKALFEANIQRQQELAERIEKRFREHTSSFGK
jgi:hemerythrin-like domain-containing protein